jgi:hypothetical protein
MVPDVAGEARTFLFRPYVHLKGKNMTLVTTASDPAAFQELISQAGFGQVIYPPNTFPTPLPLTVAGGSNWLSNLIVADGYRNVTVGVTSTQAGALVIQMYLDIAGTIARAPVSTPLVAATPLIVDLANQAPFLSMTLQITNTSGSPATISGFQLILSAG